MGALLSVGPLVQPPASPRKNLSDTVPTLEAINFKIQETENVLYGREDETVDLVRILGNVPLVLTTLLGPPQCGKTAMITHLQSVWRSAPLQVYSPFLVLDLSADECRSPGGVARLLRKALLSWKDIALASAKTISGASVAGLAVDEIIRAVEDLAAADEKASSLLGILDKLSKYVERLPGVKPVLVFDEAEYIKEWEESELRHFFLLLVYLTKETEKVHFVMVSSDYYFFQRWISEHLQWQPYQRNVGIGYFGEDEARGYVCDFLKPDAGFAEQLNELWRPMHKVAGGCPATLKQLVQDAEQHGSLAEAIDKLRRSSIGDMQARLSQMESWEVDVFRLILQSEGCLPISVVAEKLYASKRMDAEKAICKMLEKDLVHVRLWLRGCIIKDAGVKPSEDGQFVMFTKPQQRFAAGVLLSN